MSKIQTKQITLVSPNGLVEKNLTLGNDGVLVLDAPLNLLNTHLLEASNKHITESGSNANGRYIKFDDGTMICWGTVSGNITFPIVFNVAPIVQVTAAPSGAGIIACSVNAPSTSGATVVKHYWTGSTFAVAGESVMWIAIGRWKA